MFAQKLLIRCSGHCPGFNANVRPSAFMLSGPTRKQCISHIDYLRKNQYIV
ncbi:hypothetical protein HanXRQr2_Chr13g0605191 [Helianthus annuus]|uniref:Uncharacterized protein n=1 Tax=Helianthus annuus TaxID=4232 RepID=A0A9K3EJR4_HELAN|nr:hypothetical protein HanXRQr2_Chr13g0605191 [Helianthus annuus]KAJ0850643.1 hypothetical protein HanPSC8_Chr13g0583211 [Helianthus annuus]